MSGEQFVHTDFITTWTSYAEPKPISHADAFRRVAAFIENHPEDVKTFGVPDVIPVHRELTPLERTSKELACRLLQLTEAHGLDLGLTREQVETKIAQELQALRT